MDDISNEPFYVGMCAIFIILVMTVAYVELYI